MTITDQQSHLAFHLTGAITSGALHAIDELSLRPALLAPYRDLTQLRYDFPIVLLRENSSEPFASLSGIIEELVSRLSSTGEDAGRVRKHLLQLEREIRSLVAAGASDSLSKLCERAATRIATSPGHPLAPTIARARSALDCDGQVVDCDRTLPARLFVRAWRFVEDARSRKMRAHIDRLKLRLWEILRAAFVASKGGRDPAHLQASVGKTFEDAFDFNALSAALASVTSHGGLSPTRRYRIESALAALEHQQFFPATPQQKEPYSFVFAGALDVAEAWRERLPKLTELSKAMAIAELEIKGEYNELNHDPLFAAYGERGLPREELARFPTYLACMYSTAADEFTELMRLLNADIPVKALVQFDDLLENGTPLRADVALSMRSKQLADMAIGLGSVYVLQSAASNLVRAKSRIMNGLAYDGPALFSVYSGASDGTASLPPYLRSAAAMEARVFPAFAYDPSAGNDWASRFTVSDNPQPDRDWPAQTFAYEDSAHQKVAEEIDFTLVDFAALDERYAAHFAKVPAAQWNGHMAPVKAWLKPGSAPPADGVPYIAMVDENDVLQRVIVDAALIEEARRCRTVWHSLQELGGIHNSHAERLLAHEREAWEKEARAVEARKSEAAPAAPQAAAAAAAATAESAAPAAPQDEKPSDDPYIETPRCTTCEECVQINNKMFVYDANKQAYIADLAAGTYRQLVEAAESCQVSIIHPGKPRDPNEAGLAELIERAQPFM
ncbi:MAG: ferredoxin [Burkholderiales bacterium]